MNLGEGTRRLALFLVAAGAILGGFASYLELQSVLSQRARHNAFQSLAGSESVQQERKSWSLTLAYTPERAIATLRKLTEDQQRDVVRGLTQEEKADLMAKLKCTPVPGGASPTAGAVPQQPQIDPGTGERVVDPFACIAEPIEPPTSAVNKGGIKAIHWTRDLSVASIETDDGQTLYPTPTPAGWSYFLIVLFPVLGFFIPWALVRAIGWVGAGFAADPK